MSQSGLATLRDYIRWAISQFNQAQLFFIEGEQGAYEEARALVLGCLHLPSQLHDKYLDCNLHTDEHPVLQAILKKRIEQRLPAAYLLGQAWFAELLFKVDQRVLIPRSPLEELIPQQFSPWLIDTPKRVLNLYTGSGYLGMTCAIEFPDAQVVLADASTQALAVAAENIAAHQLSPRVQTLHSDLFAQLAEQRFDLIICKPPYLSAEDWAQLPPELQHEPQYSSVAGQDGLEIIQQVLQQAGQYLTEQGLLVLEVGPHQTALQALYPEIDFTWLEHSQPDNAVLALMVKQCIAD